MTDFVGFADGEKHVLDVGLPPTLWFLLSTRSVAKLPVESTLAAGVGEITGTGYQRVQQTTPGFSPSQRGVKIHFEPVVWETSVSRDWPDQVRSCLLVTTADNTGKAICAWNLQPGGRPRNMADAFITEIFTPTIEVERTARA